MPKREARIEGRVLANVYRFVLDCHANREAARHGRPTPREKPESGSEPRCPGTGTSR